MNVIARRLICCVITVFCGCFFGLTHAKAQQDTAARIDSAPSSFVRKMQQFARDSKAKSIEELNNDKATLIQDALLENIKKTMQHARGYLKNGIDTSGINEDLVNISNWQTIAGDGIFTNKGTAQTFRNLTTSYNLLLVLEKRLINHKINLDNFQHKLSLFRFQIDSLSSDSSMFSFSNDSATLRNYLQRLVAVAYEIEPVDSVLKKAMADVRVLQSRVNLQVYQVASSKDEIELYQREIYRNTFSREFPELWKPLTYDRPFTEVVAYSKVKGWLTLRFYVQNNLGKILLLLLIILLSAIYLRSLKKIYRQKELLTANFAGQLVLRYPTLSATIIVINVFQFIFPAPPFIFSAILWTTAATALTIVFRHFISTYWMWVWLSMLLLYVFATADNVILQASREERWYMLLLALIGVIAGCMAVIKGNKAELKEQWITWSIGFLVVLEFASIVANCFGRYNFSKTLLTSGYFNVVIAIMFLWTVRLINEGLNLAFNVYVGQDKKLFYINFQRVGNKAHPLFYCCMIAGWLILFGNNFYAFRLITNPVKDFLTGERQVGDYSFSINTLLLFVFIMVLSVIISRIVSYFASDRHLSASGAAAKEGKTGLGSWLLLVRISIIMVGVFFAFAAAGIPMDKIALILGALGVGIGFGLQTLVNNLVSGLIIAFEKPVNVGDVVEIDNQAGTMKSIGFRSSVISTWDGADLVMPNGDLLNSHLINWTLGGNKRRMNIVLGVAYGTDLDKTKQVLNDAMAADDRILQYPAPLVLFQEFNNSSIDVKLLFWVRHLKDGFPARSDLIVAINQAFAQHGIRIPFPQQDIHIINTDTGEKDPENDAPEPPDKQ
jgi:small-conductance mechanosensitive channel